VGSEEGFFHHLGGLGRIVSGAALIFAASGRSAVLSLPNTDTSTAVTDFPVVATAVYRLQNTGSTVSDTSAPWVVPGDAAPNYDVKATIVSGAVSTGTIGSWLNLGTTRSWTVSQNGAGENSATITVQIAYTGTTTVLDQVEVTLTATVASA
jgi:hypothetical protein